MGLSILDEDPESWLQDARKLISWAPPVFLIKGGSHPDQIRARREHIRQGRQRRQGAIRSFRQPVEHLLMSLQSRIFLQETYNVNVFHLASLIKCCFTLFVLDTHVHTFMIQ